jgi:hypothetical protein
MNGDPAINLPAGFAAADLDPLIVTAPVIRSGTTLLQRLLCSSRQALIYGEMSAQDLEFFLNLYTFKVQEYTYHKQMYAAGLGRILQGDVNDWIPDLMPDIDEYLAAMSQSAFAGIIYCREYAAKVRRPLWGFKHPGWKPPMIRLLRAVTPKSRFIFIYRDVIDCLKSAKAQQAINSHQEVHEFCQAWVEGVEYLLNLGDDPAVLVLRYEELVSEPETALVRIAEFSGVDDMNPAVLQRKINAWTGEDYVAQARNGYTPPAELTEVEMQIVEATTSALRASLYADVVA